jgi:polyhydroxyalkanoate synthesis regulator phasin
MKVMMMAQALIEPTTQELADEIAKLQDELKIQCSILHFAQQCPELRYTMWDAKEGIKGLEERVQRLKDQLRRLEDPEKTRAP